MRIASLSNDGVFNAAQDAFRATLSSKDCVHYTPASSTELLSSLRQFKKLNSRLQTYFDALNVIASVDDTAALAYGAVRVVLQLACALPTFFDKLLTTIDRLADTFPQYEAIIGIFDDQPAPRMRQHLEKVYQDFFEFLRLAAKVFTASSGRIKRPAEMIANVIWKPFDATFSDILSRMDYHRNFVLEELEILQAQRAKDVDREAALERAQAEKERHRAEESRERTRRLEDLAWEAREAHAMDVKESSVRRTMSWLSPPRFAEALEISQEHRIDGTAEWIFDEIAFTAWGSTKAGVHAPMEWITMPPWVLWVYASSVYDKLVEDKSTQEPHNMTCYFFFKHTDPANSTIEAAFRSALTQIIHRNRNNTELLDKFLFIQSDPVSSSGQLHATAKELFDLMCMCANSLGQITFIVDGIDEAIDPGDVSMKLTALTTTAPVKLICFSRPNVSQLQCTVPALHCIDFNRHVANADIRVFLECEIQTMIEERKIPTTADVSVLGTTLLGGADGMFLWAKLMIRYLRSPALKPSRRLRIIDSVSFPEGLDVMYDRIVSLILASNKPEMELAKSILFWIQANYSDARMNIDWLRAAVGDYIDPDETEKFSSLAVAVCGGLVEFSERDGFRYMHLTVREYFDNTSSGRREKDTLVPEPAKARFEIVSACIKYLISHAPLERPTLRIPGNTSGEDMLKFRESFEAFATRSWVDNLVDISPDTLFTDSDNGQKKCAEEQYSVSLKAMISSFLDKPLALGFWVEILYSIQTPIEVIVSQIMDWTRQVSIYSDDSLAKRLQNFAGDLQSIENEWGSRLLVQPNLLWNDVMLFSRTKTLSMLDTSNIGTVTTLRPENAGGTMGSRIPFLCSISAASRDGLTTGVLSIMPSAEFVQFWHSTITSEAYGLGEKFCGGWTAIYELWQSGSNSRVASLNIPLSQVEVRILFRQSFRQRGHECQVDSVNFDTSFPLAIGHDCLAFSVLRTIYKVLPDEPKSLTEYLSCLLPLEFLDHFKAKWGQDLKMFCPDNHGTLPHMFHISWRDWYTYLVSFSPDGKLVAFADYQQPCLMNMAVFEIHPGPSLGLQRIHSIKARLGLPRVKDMQFHVDRPLLIFLADTKVWLWPFNDGKRKFDTGHVEPSDRVKSVSSLERGLWPLERTTSGSCLNLAGYAPTATSLMTANNIVELKIHQRNSSGSKANIQLLALPNSFDTTNIAISTKIPTEPDQPLTITLNKSVSEDYTLERHKDFTHPIIIEKSVRSIVGILDVPSMASDARSPPPLKRIKLPRRASDPEHDGQND
ncbi:hypothetical protein SCUP234_12307 [Seiridium cupressi]